MLVIPAIDIRNGQCVRLEQGQPGMETRYGVDPVEMALMLQDKGAKLLHVVDLDGAIDGVSENLTIIKLMTEALTIPIELGGGIRTTTDVMMRFNRCGAWRIVLGTVAAQKPDIMIWAAKDYPGRVAVGIDARDGIIKVNGWQDSVVELGVMELALEAKEAGIDTVIYTDISKDGMLQGPNVKATQELIEQTGMKVIASGGVTRMEDLEELERIGAHGAIVGKAMYDGRLDIGAALMRFGGDE